MSGTPTPGARLWPLLLLLLVPACTPDDAAPPDSPLMSQAEQTACTAVGGLVRIAGFSGQQFCAELLPDAGQSCSRATDCLGRCEAETRTCQTHASPFGCHSFLDENGSVQSICTD